MARPIPARAWILLPLLLALAAPATPAAAQTRYPVPYLFSANVIAAATQPGSAPPGANDWSCRPSRSHPRPVVLVHGLLATMTDNWQTMSPLLANNGYCVFALTYGTQDSEMFGGLTRMEHSAAELRAFVNQVLTTTGASKVDIVGHSEGATMPDYYIEYLGGAKRVAHYVGVSGVKHGTTLHGVATTAALIQSFFPGAPSPTSGLCDSCDQFIVGSEYIQKIEARAPAAGVIYTNIATRYDELVSPYTSSFLAGPNVSNITVQDRCALDASDHLSIISSPRTGRMILNALDPARAQPVPCTVVLPAA
ncbi:MAG TPA: alpha/beta fold hydrolase [Acidimicrobiia bacterium]|nr:alpha/beta fold hydrolase [Acidimicrobiia bacterium]